MFLSWKQKSNKCYLHVQITESKTEFYQVIAFPLRPNRRKYICTSVAYLRPTQISTTEYFRKIVNGCFFLSIFATKLHHRCLTGCIFCTFWTRSWYSPYSIYIYYIYIYICIIYIYVLYVLYMYVLYIYI